MPEEDKGRQKPQDEKLEELVEAADFQEEEEVDGFDFGGLPADKSFKRNMGCGG